MPRLETVLAATSLGAALALGAGYVQLRGRLDACPSSTIQIPVPPVAPEGDRGHEAGALARALESLRLRVAELERLSPSVQPAPAAPSLEASLDDPAIQARLRQILGPALPASPNQVPASRPVGFEGLGLDPARHEELTRLMEESSQHLQSVLGRMRCGEWTRAQARAEAQRHRIETDARVRTLLNDTEFERFAAAVAPMRHQTDRGFDIPAHAPAKGRRNRQEDRHAPR